MCNTLLSNDGYAPLNTPALEYTEECYAAQCVAEDTHVFRCVEPALGPCPVRYRIIIEVVLELFSMQESSEEHLEGDLARSLRIIR